MAVILKRRNYNVLHAINGLEAVNIVKEQSVHIVLMDIEMPIMNDFIATREIRKFNPDIPIIAVTASVRFGYWYSNQCHSVEDSYLVNEDLPLYNVNINSIPTINIIPQDLHCSLQTKKYEYCLYPLSSRYNLDKH